MKLTQVPVKKITLRKLNLTKDISNKSWVFNIFKSRSTIPLNEEIIRHNICNVEFHLNIYDD